MMILFSVKLGPAHCTKKYIRYYTPLPKVDPTKIAPSPGGEKEAGLIQSNQQHKGKIEQTLGVVLKVLCSY